MKTLYRDRRVSQKEIRELRERGLDASQEQFAHLLGVTLGTVSRWERGEVQPDDRTAEKLLRLRRIAGALSAVMDPGSALKWLETPREQFNGNPPIDLTGSNFSTIHLERFIDEWVSGAPHWRKTP